MEVQVSTQDLVLCLSEAIDLISPSLSHHHRLVAGVAWQFCDELGLSQAEKKEILYACAVHDVGALSESEKNHLLHLDYEEDESHAKKGYLFFREFQPFADVAEFIRYHHSHWNHTLQFDCSKNKIRVAANIIYISDRIAVSINANRNILSQAEGITAKILSFGERLFSKELLETFLNLSKREAFWLNIVTYSLKEIFMRNIVANGDDKVDNYQFIKIFSRIIDFRSNFTATHSSGVAATAKAMAYKAGFSELDQEKIEIAGFVHDLGKLAVPTEILEKRGSLLKEEYSYIRAHTYYTDFILSRIENFDDIRQWASQHHEKLNGTGYPFHLEGEQLSTGSRIMAVSDVFVALFEDRPYRKGMEKNRAIDIIQNMANSALDEQIVQLLINNFDFINDSRIQAQVAAASEYNEFEEEFLHS